MNKITRTFGVISEEEILQCEFLESLKKDHETVAEHSLSQRNLKLLHKEWIMEIIPEYHLVLRVTYE